MKRPIPDPEHLSILAGVVYSSIRDEGTAVKIAAKLIKLSNEHVTKLEADEDA